jgi:hypothetical protein
MLLALSALETTAQSNSGCNEVNDRECQNDKGQAAEQGNPGNARGSARTGFGSGQVIRMILIHGDVGTPI